MLFFRGSAKCGPPFPMHKALQKSHTEGPLFNFGEESGFLLEIWINLVGLLPSRRFFVLLLRRIFTLHVRSDDATAAQIALKLNRMRNQHQISIIIYSESFAIETHYT